MDVIFPSLVSAGVGEGDDYENSSAESVHSPNGQRPFFGAELFFFLQPYSPASIPHRSKMTSIMTGQPRKRKRSQDEENMYKAQLAATGLILSELQRLIRGQ